MHQLLVLFKSKHREEGFTLIELLVVVAILGVLAAIGITLSVLAFLFIDNVLAHISARVLVFLVGSLCIPFFVLKAIYEQKYPVSKLRKRLGWAIAFLGFILSMFIDRLI